MKYLIVFLILFIPFSNLYSQKKYPISKEKALQIVENIPAVRNNNLKLESFENPEKIYDYETGKLIGTYYTVKMEKYQTVLVNAYNGKLLITQGSLHNYFPLNNSDPSFYYLGF